MNSALPLALARPSYVYREWIRAVRLASRSKMLSRCLAEDWIFLAVLLPLTPGAPADPAHPLAVTHTVGDLRREVALAALAVDLDLLKHSLPSPRSSRRGALVQELLEREYRGTLACIDALVDWKVFWSHASRWISCLNMGGSESIWQPGSLLGPEVWAWNHSAAPAPLALEVQ